MQFPHLRKSTRPLSPHPPFPGTASSRTFSSSLFLDLLRKTTLRELISILPKAPFDRQGRQSIGLPYTQLAPQLPQARHLFAVSLGSFRAPDLSESLHPQSTA